jgi:hypothetical protein
MRLVGPVAEDSDHDHQVLHTVRRDLWWEIEIESQARSERPTQGERETGGREGRIQDGARVRGHCREIEKNSQDPALNPQQQQPM